MASDTPSSRGPSYVLGGRAMQVVDDRAELESYIEKVTQPSPEHPVLIDKYLQGREVEVDAICDGRDSLIPGIMEHIERAGVHSGDSFAVYPPVSVSPEKRPCSSTTPSASAPACASVDSSTFSTCSSAARFTCWR